MSNNSPLSSSTRISRFNFKFAFIIFALVFIGLINLYSATHSLNLGHNTQLFWKQLVWVFIGWGIFLSVTFLDYDFFKRFAYPFYFFNVIALICVKLFGHTALGAQRWIDLGFFMWQPSETAKISIAIVLAKIFCDKSYPNGLGVKDLFLPAIITVIPFVLTLKQPDLGTSLLIIGIAASMIIFIRVKWSILIFVLVTSVLATPLLWNFGLKSYQKDRVKTFLNPGSDPRGKGYNSIQSKVAVGSGRLLGKGFRKGTQSQLEFIPERHSDFIYSVLSEEHGFIGSLFALGLFAILFFTSLRISYEARDKFGALLVIGIFSFVFFHTFINIGMVVGILPIVGMPLPLLSYGGSSMMTIMLGLGLISSVSYHRFLF